MNKVLAIINGELRFELRSRRAWLPVLLYIASVVFIVYTGIKQTPDSTIWNVVFWTLIIFIAMFASSGSFSGRENEMVYLYTLFSPGMFVLARLLYNGVFLFVVSISTFIIYSFFLGNPVTEVPLFLVTVFLSSWGISSLLTVASFISHKGGGGFTLMASISFPLLAPLLLLAEKLSQQCLEQVTFSGSGGFLLALLAMDILIATLGYLLFSYLWRD
jgi:heme exporter protein B